MNRNVPYGFLNVTKLLLTAVLIILSIVDLGFVLANTDHQNVFEVDYYTTAIKIVTFVSK